MSVYRGNRKQSLIQHISGRQLKVGGYKPDHHDPTDKKYGVGRYQAEDLPPRVDLRSFLTPVESQGDLNSCTANAMAGAYEYLATRQLGTANFVSRLFIYYNARSLDGASDLDEGTYLRSCIKVLREYGTCIEDTWPYSPDSVFDEPGDDAYQEAANFLIEEAKRVDVDLHAMRHCLAEGYPFAFGLELFASFDKTGKDGKVPMPNPNSEEHQGGHAMLCVGYSDQDRVFIIRNSWGKDWGDNGYCYIHYDYFTNPDFNGDCWSIHSLSDVDFSEGVWHEAGSVLGDAEDESDEAEVEVEDDSDQAEVEAEDDSDQAEVEVEDDSEEDE